MIEPLAAVNRMLRNRLTSSIGRAVLFSTKTNTARITTPVAMSPSVRPEPHPQFGAWMMLRISVAMPALDKISPRQSMGGALGSRDVGTAHAIIAATKAATGTMNKKTLPHQKCPSSHPPTIGPVATPTPVVAPHKPIAFARSARSVKTLAINESVEGKMAAAPRPITARAAISSPGVCTSEPASEPAAKTPSPASSIPLRPTRSLRLPAARISAANTKLYASTTHCRLVVVAPSSRTSDGSVTFTIVTSMLMISAARQSAKRIAPLLLRARGTASSMCLISQCRGLEQRLIRVT